MTVTQAKRVLPVAIVGLHCLLAFSSVSWGVEVTSGPDLQLDPNALTPLAAQVQFSTDVSVRASIEVVAPNETWSVDFDEFLHQHSLPILGLKPNTAYSITVTITVEDTGEEVVLEPTLQTLTAPLPDDFPLIDVLISQPALMEPGYTLLDLFRRARGEPGGQYMIILDEQGDVVWYSTAGASGTRRLANGNLFYRTGPTAVEMDLLGNDVRVIELENELNHHDFFETGDGTFLSLTRATVTVENYPGSEIDPEAPTQIAEIEDDPVVEFNADGSVRNVWPLTEILDPTRIGYGSVSIEQNFGLDWAHANAVIHDPNDDTIVVSVRHQDVVAKFSRATGDLKWLLGTHANWDAEFEPALLSPIGTPFEWQYHQHSPMYTPAGNLLLLDNGNRRASPFDGNTPVSEDANYTRAVEYEIDEQAMTIRQVWEYGMASSPRVFSGAMSDADWMLETGNVLLVLSTVQYVDGVESAVLGYGERHTRVIEVDHGTPAQKVFEIAVYNPDPQGRIQAYRGERIPSLYPSPDGDADGIRDRADNCLALANPHQRDTDHDGFGNLCDADINNDCAVNFADLAAFKSVFFTEDPNADFNGDGAVNFVDLATMKASLFSAPGPSGASDLCAND